MNIMENDNDQLLSSDNILVISPETKERRAFQECFGTAASEFLTTAIFVFIGTMSFVQESLIGIAVAHGLTISLLVITFGRIR